MRIIQVRHYYHKFLSRIEELGSTKELLIKENNEAIIIAMNGMTRQIFDTSKSISILYETGLYSQAAVLSRTLFELTVVFSYMISDKDKFKSRMSTYLSDVSYKTKILSDIKELKIPFDKEIDENLINMEKLEMLNILEIKESDLENKMQFYKIITIMELRLPYSLFYRCFSQHVHSKTSIFEISNTENKEKLGNKAMLCGCYCFLLFYLI